MFPNDSLKEHIETSSVIQNKAFVTAEWNLNTFDNIFSIGNYRHRPSERRISEPEGRSVYAYLMNVFDPNDEGYFYTDAANADAVIDGGLIDDEENNPVPIAFRSINEKQSLLFSLEDCFGKFRPRSGINKLRYLPNSFIHHTNRNMDKRPRYYMPSKDDKFKYWSSYITKAYYKYEYGDDTVAYGDNPVFIDNGVTKNGTLVSSAKELGVALGGPDNLYYIDDAAPFIVYKAPVAANRIVVKMQTNIGTVDLGPFGNSTSSFDDPFYGQENSTTPIRWKVQYLEDNVWIDAVAFDEDVSRLDGSPVIGPDGYVELSYGLLVPEQYRSIFFKAGEVYSQYALPQTATDGEAYLVKSSDTALGTYYIWLDGQYKTFAPRYGWYLTDTDIQNSDAFVTELVNTPQYLDTSTSQTKYREFQYISGLRVVVETMNKPGCSFDLIELSPRLITDLSDKVISFAVNKVASDLGISGMPVGQLLAGTGEIEIFDYDLAFYANNTQSIIAPYLLQKTQIKFYEIIKDADNVDNYIPMQTLYSEGFPETDLNQRQTAITLRDLFFLFEETTAPELLIPNAPLSYAISTLLDNVGFSNYVFKRFEDEAEPIIPFFMVQPDVSVAEVLEQLAISTQSAMFFDEYNNLVIMSKNYIMPTEEQRPTDIVLYGSKDFRKTGAYTNETTNNKLANIVSLASQENKVYNDGQISYTSRYIQKSFGTVREASFTLRNKSWVYKPALLWEITGDQKLFPINEDVGNASNYTLTAIPLNADLSALLPVVENNELVNNVIDFGEGIDYISRYNGYFYANGEVIRFDAVEFSVAGEADNVWISSVQEFQKYFANLPFNGKIYPTGLVRIYAEPNYEVINGITRMKNGAVAKHGRGQFGTKVVAHSSGLSNYWSSNTHLRGCRMDVRYLFGKKRFNPTNKLTYIKTNFSWSVDYLTITIPNDNINATDIAVDNVIRILPKNPSIPIPADKILASTVKTKTVNEGSVVLLLNVAVNVIEFCIDNKIDFDLEAVLSTQQDVYNFIDESGAQINLAQRSTRTGIIKNFLSASDVTENELNQFFVTQTGTMQSSALVFSGGKYTDSEKPIENISYVYKSLEDGYKHFGTRLRIVGTVKDDTKKTQQTAGSMPYYSVTPSSSDQSPIIAGGSAGIACLLNKNTNVGYYFEIISIDGFSTVSEGLNNYANYDTVHNVVFYKVVHNLEPDAGESDAIPVKLWGGLANILVDSGDFTGQYRFFGEENPSVYDLAVEYENVGATRKFYLYINNALVQVVEDTDPLPEYNDMALFIRGSTKAMFENVYALSGNYVLNQESYLTPPVNNVFGNDKFKVSSALQKYSISGMIQSTYLSGISQNNLPGYNIYFEEFGTIMREAAYINAKYDKAYPALYATIAPVFTKLRGYTISGFTPGAYRAEFLVFNTTDTLLNLDETTGNYLRILGITFTQESSNELTVDQYFSKLSDFSDPVLQGKEVAVSPLKAKQDFFDIKNSRLTYGKQEFTLEAPYIQSYDDANDLMGWMISKIMKPRLAIGVDIFSNPLIQLGDIVQIEYSDTTVTPSKKIVPSSARFVVYNIEYQRSNEGPSMKLYLSEVK